MTLLALAQQPGAQTLESCAAISAAADRLACYDRVSGRATPSNAAPAIPTHGAPAPPAVPAVSSAPSAQTLHPPLSAPAEVPVNPPQAPPAQVLPPESFGLYRAEHPTVPSKQATLTAKVITLGVLANTHQSVTLDGGQLWEVDSPDPLLETGDTVTIKRAALGSFILKTPSGRTSRAYRLR